MNLWSKQLQRGLRQADDLVADGLIAPELRDPADSIAQMLPIRAPRGYADLDG